MLDLDHFADEVGRLDQLGRGVAAGDDHVLEAGAIAQRGDEMVATRADLPAEEVVRQGADAAPKRTRRDMPAVLPP